MAEESELDGGISDRYKLFMVSLGLSGVIFVVNESRKQVPPAPPHPILNFIAADPSRPEPPPYFKLHNNNTP
jgi:hypothetical protein